MTILRRTTERRRPPAGADERDDGRWAVYELHGPAIRAYAARRVERDAVDDVVAETFAIAWRRLPREADPLPWLYAVARRVVHGHRRGHARRGALLQRVAGGAAAAIAAPDPAEQVHGDPALARAFATLTEQEREAIRLVAWEQLDHADAARAAGCSRATFAVRLSRARARLRIALDASRAEVAQVAPRAAQSAPRAAQSAPRPARAAPPPRAAAATTPTAHLPTLEPSR